MSVALAGRSDDHSDMLDELGRLADTAGAEVLECIVQKRASIDPAYFIGKGKAEEIRELVRELDIDVVIFDNDLSPAQVRNLERTVGTKVIDRSELILDIFAKRARTKQAKLQVELAQLEYAFPRLRRLWTHLERVKGGIGMRGPGEKQLEVDRRLAADRIARLKRELRSIEKRQVRHIQARKDCYTVSLVGYTNAGKSTLMNALTSANVPVDDLLFSTLDTKTRLWTTFSGKRILLSDTVGFIRNLPHRLVASFHATLEEAVSADLLMHVVDASHPHAINHIQVVNEVLGELNCLQKPQLLVFNKCDLLRDKLQLHILQKKFPEHVTISALHGQGLDELKALVEQRLDATFVEDRLTLHPSDGKLVHFIHTHSRLLSRQLHDGQLTLTFRMDKKNHAKLMHLMESMRNEQAHPRGTSDSCVSCNA